MRFFVLFTFTFLWFCGDLYTQNASHDHCGTDEYTAALIAENPEVARQYARTDSILAAEREGQNLEAGAEAAPLYRIPVVVHIIYDTEYDNISRSQIEDALRVLNEDFRRQNSDRNQTRPMFLQDAADVEVEFALAKKDPQGNCTDGINRVQSAQSVNANDNVKDLIQWDRTKYMNVWVVNSISGSGTGGGQILGYAYRPFFGQGYKRDGIVIRHDRFGSIGTSVSLGRTFTHETGHYLGLLHPFDNGCTGGDGIGDTPPVATASFGCNLNKNTCSNDSPDRPDMVENYMDYSDDDCQNLFTNGQKSAMRASLQNTSLRQNLRTPGNLAATGLTAPPACPPEARVAHLSRVYCPGGLVSFGDETEGGDPDQWKWYFPHGQPVTSTQQNPQVTYQGAGFFDVALVVSNNAGSDSLFLEDFVEVKPYWTDHNSEWREDFESELDIPSVSVLSLQDTVAFRRTNQAASSGSWSLFLDNFNTTARGAVDEFISPHIFTLFGHNIVMTFDYAFASQSSNNSDNLRVYASDDCGVTWNERRLFSGSMLNTAGNPVNAPFVPTSSQWRSGFVPLGAFDLNPDPILIKFEFTNGGGNNLYIDNIDLAAANVELTEEDLERHLHLYPNPARDEVRMSWGMALPADKLLRIYNISGQMVGEHRVPENARQYRMSVSNLAPGVYFVQFGDNPAAARHKLIVK